MADIELIIKIPEEDYHFVKKQVADGITNPLKICIAKGTPLPEGHGDLIDRRELIKSGVSRGFCDWYDEIKYAETIIKADDKNKAKSATSYDSNEEDREI